MLRKALSPARWLGLGLLVTTLFALTVTRPNPVTAASEDLSTDVVLVLLSPVGQAVGTPLLWAAQPQMPSADLLYQFSIKPPGGDYRVVRDYHGFPFLAYAPMVEGTYGIRLRVREAPSSEVGAEMTDLYQVASRVTAGMAVVSETSNPLVALYSASACAGPSQFIRVRFRTLLGLFWHYTNWKPCDTARSNNFHVAGMKAQSTYLIQHEVAALGSRAVRSPRQIFTTGELPDLPFPQVTVLNPPDARTSLLDGVLLQSSGIRPGGDEAFPFATDLLGNVIWYHYFPTLFFEPARGGSLLRVYDGGTMAVVAEYRVHNQGYREIDLAGNTLRETNSRALSEQLMAMGEDPIIGVHHDALRLASGHTLLLAYVLRTMEIEGNEVDVLGDMVLQIDEDMQVVWVWNVFDHLPATAKILDSDICPGPSPGGGGCPPLERPAYDWTHANTLDYVETDANLLMSIRHLDWVIKVNYADGTGDGSVIWKLGAGGDFQLVPDDPSLWFSHQHYSHFVDFNQIVVNDNGNTRCRDIPLTCLSRGQLWTIDEHNMTARVDLNADLSFYAPALGAAGKLSNGNYHFTAALLPPNEPLTQMAEFRPNGAKVYDAYVDASLYRGQRLISLYRTQSESALGSGVASQVTRQLPREEAVDAGLLWADLLQAQTDNNAGLRIFLPSIRP